MAYQRIKQRGIHHVCLRVPDLYRTVKFYQDALDAEIICEWGAQGQEDHAFIMDLGEGDFLEIFPSSESFGIGSWQHVAVWTDNINESFERALQCGATVYARPQRSDIPTRGGQIVRMYYGFVRAPGNEIIEFIQDIPEEG